MFSSRVPAVLTPNRLTARLSALRAAGEVVLDLSESNPTRAGIDYPAGLLAPLADPAGLRYEPSARGLLVARQAIALDALRHGLDLDPARIVLTASTSEAYGFLFKLLCDPGDEVLVPRPSYPLFEHLSSLDGVRALPYTLDYYGRWSIDVDTVTRAITPRTRAILVVSPNNPTGSRLAPGELDALAALCEQHGLALIGDEVFAEYTLMNDALINDAGGAARSGSAGAAGAAGVKAGRERPHVSVLAQQRALTFGLGGLSKSIGLPQVKLGWIGIGGPGALVEGALERLDLIADTYLSVSTPVQLAAPLLIERGHAVRTAIQARIAANLRALERAVARAPGCTLLHPEAGWTAVLRVPAIAAEEDLVLDLLEQDRVLIMPGYFYDFPREAYLVVSLLPDPAVFNEAVARVLARAEAEPRV
jgi:alanine-synthesizing transaminase